MGRLLGAYSFFKFVWVIESRNQLLQYTSPLKGYTNHMTQSDRRDSGIISIVKIMEEENFNWYLEFVIS